MLCGTIIGRTRTTTLQTCFSTPDLAQITGHLHKTEPEAKLHKKKRINFKQKLPFLLNILPFQPHIHKVRWLLLKTSAMTSISHHKTSNTSYWLSVWAMCVLTGWTTVIHTCYKKHLYGVLSARPQNYWWRHVGVSNVKCLHWKWFVRGGRVEVYRRCTPAVSQWSQAPLVLKKQTVWGRLFNHCGPILEANSCDCKRYWQSWHTVNIWRHGLQLAHRYIHNIYHILSFRQLLFWLVFIWMPLGDKSIEMWSGRKKGELFVCLLHVIKHLCCSVQKSNQSRLSDLKERQ